MNYQTQIDNIIEQALTEKTFSLEIINKIKELKDAVETLESENSELDEKLKRNAEKTAQQLSEKQFLEVEFEEVKKQLETYKSREADIARREGKQEVVDVTIRYEQQRVHDIKELVSLVFKNPTFVRESSQFGNTSYTPNYNGGQNSPPNECRNKTETVKEHIE